MSNEDSEKCKNPKRMDARFWHGAKFVYYPRIWTGAERASIRCSSSAEKAV